MDDDARRVAKLLEAQHHAATLFDEIERRALVSPGRLESQVSREIRDVAANALGVTRHWHKRVVRSGPNTLQPYHQNPPDREIEADDIVFVDLGPIFEDWEADFGRSYVLGDDPVKHRLVADLPVLFDAGRDYFLHHPEVTGEELFHHVVALAEDRGWTWGGTIAGHLVGHFPHDAAPGGDAFSRVMPGNDRAMRTVDASGRPCHWILEIHIVDVGRQIGGFFEELLDVGTDAA
ncbi:MAG: aminopeptidase P family protein [Frankiaceae bacterium]|nr:aminopeptidase P family protein [Frankiaceae bacterium]MBV9872366.1 aminopeptidase P family protein [Frankiaceae bacterium]